MWKLAYVEDHHQWVDVVEWSASGTRFQSLEPKAKRDPERRNEVRSLYDQAIIDLLKDGWEPFGVKYEGSEVWFRMTVEE